MHDRRPHFLEVFEAVCNGAVLVASDKRAHDSYVELLGRLDDDSEVIVCRLAGGGVGVQVVGVVRERRDLQVVSLEQGAYLLGIETVDVDVCETPA